MTRRKSSKKTEPEVALPAYIVEPGFPVGDGPRWIADAVGAVPGTPVQAVAYHGTTADETAIALHIGGVEVVFRPARLITARRLADELGARGFPIPYYQPPQLYILGQAIARLAYRDQEAKDQTANDDLASLLGGWANDCLRENVVYELNGREGADVRAAIEHVRTGHTHGSPTIPLIVDRKGKALLAWTIPVRAVIRERVGTMSDGDIGVQLQRSGLTRTRLDARPAPGTHGGTIGMPFWAIPNGWQGVEAPNARSQAKSGASGGAPVRDRSEPPTHARPSGRTRGRNV